MLTWFKPFPWIDLDAVPSKVQTNGAKIWSQTSPSSRKNCQVAISPLFILSEDGPQEPLILFWGSLRASCPLTVSCFTEELLFSETVGSSLAVELELFLLESLSDSLEEDSPLVEEYSVSGESSELDEVDSEEQTTPTVGVRNSSGSTLPVTGGMGTTLFYVLGSAMVLGAALLLVSKKRYALKK